MRFANFTATQSQDMSIVLTWVSSIAHYEHGAIFLAISLLAMYTSAICHLQLFDGKFDESEL